MASTWGASWGAHWANAWGGVTVPPPSVILVGGDDAPKKRRRRKERRELFREIEATVHELLHPAPAVEAHAEVQARMEAGTARQLVDELVVLAEGQHQLIRRAAVLRTELASLEAARWEQEDEDELMLFI